MKGSGVCLIVDPMKFDTATRAFSRDSGILLRLEPKEILANFQKMNLPDDKPVDTQNKGLFDNNKPRNKPINKPQLKSFDDPPHAQETKIK